MKSAKVPRWLSFGGFKKQKPNLLTRTEESQRRVGGKDSEAKDNHSIQKLNWLPWGSSSCFHQVGGTMESWAEGLQLIWQGMSKALAYGSKLAPGLLSYGLFYKNYVYIVKWFKNHKRNKNILHSWKTWYNCDLIWTNKVFLESGLCLFIYILPIAALHCCGRTEWLKQKPIQPSKPRNFTVPPFEESAVWFLLL